MANANKFRGVGPVYVGNTKLCVQSWSITVMAETLDTTDSCSQGYKENIAGLKEANGTVTAQWDSTKTYHNTSTPNLNEGAQMPLKLYLKEGAAAYYYLPRARIEQFNPSGEVNGVFQFSFNYRSNGSFTSPSSSF